MGVRIGSAPPATAPSSELKDRASRLPQPGAASTSLEGTYGRELVHRIVAHLLHLLGSFGFVGPAKVAEGLDVMLADPDAMLGATFAAFDANGDGAIDATDLATTLSLARPFFGVPHAELVAKFDAVLRGAGGPRGPKARHGIRRSDLDSVLMYTPALEAWTLAHQSRWESFAREMAAMDAGELGFGSSEWSRTPIGAAAIASMRPSWPPPKIPIFAVRESPSGHIAYPSSSELAPAAKTPRGATPTRRDEARRGAIAKGEARAEPRPERAGEERAGRTRGAPGARSVAHAGGMFGYFRRPTTGPGSAREASGVRWIRTRSDARDVADADARARAVSDPRGTLRRASTPRSKTPDRRRFAREKVQGRIGRRGKAHHVLPEGRASDQRGLRLRG